MSRSFTIAGLTLVVLAAAIWCVGCGSEGGDEIVARVGRTDITKSYLMEKLADLPPFAQQEFAGPEGTIAFLHRLVDEEVLYQAALKAGYDQDPEVVRALAVVKRRAVIQAFYAAGVEATTVVSDEDVQIYYDEHSEQFQRRGRIKFRHLLVPTRAEADGARLRVLGGEDFASVAREVSTDSATRNGGGLMPSIAQGDGAPNAGMDAAFIESIREWKAGEVTDPLRSDRGWHIAYIEQKVDEGTKPLEEVHESIVKSLLPERRRENYEEILAGLKESYGVTVNEDVFRAKPRTEEELFTLAQETDDPLSRLNYYSELVFNYPDGGHAAEAQFMIGFIHAEELSNYEAARNAFERMKTRYPDSDLVASADWM
ncbi:MAG: peptidyl-prolyl cis-trans isomerase, partial [Candidatus Eisenbacteria sp.]|nr:peptidyl-prolyl cis-trans isomerase [Candidatus Eisenbacteria bacterium]